MFMECHLPAARYSDDFFDTKHQVAVRNTFFELIVHLSISDPCSWVLRMLPYHDLAVEPLGTFTNTTIHTLGLEQELYMMFEVTV